MTKRELVKDFFMTKYAESAYTEYGDLGIEIEQRSETPYNDIIYPEPDNCYLLTIYYANDNTISKSTSCYNIKTRRQFITRYLPFTKDELKFLDLNNIELASAQEWECKQKVEDWIYEENE